MTTTPFPPGSNDRDELARLLPDPVQRDLPSDRTRQLQEYVMSEIRKDRLSTATRPVPRRRLVLATSALAASLLAASAVATGGFGIGRDQAGHSAAPPAGTSTKAVDSPVALTFELAAAYAAATPFTPPRPDQWIYVENRYLSPSALAADKGQQPDVTTRVWTKADGTQVAGTNPETGALETWTQRTDYPELAQLPTDPDVLLSLLRAELMATPSDPRAPRAIIATTPDEWDGLLFLRIARILDANLLPPTVTAALWRAAALVPGVTLSPETIDAGGRPAIAVGRIQDGWRFEQLLLDPDTHEFVGYRSVAVKDHTYTTPNGPVTEKAGDVQFVTTRLAARIVDAAGQTN